MRRLTKASGGDNLTYLRVSFADLPDVTEVRLSQFNEMVHSFCLAERAVAPGEFEAGAAVMGPLLLGQDEGHALLLGYEHGSQAPDAFLRYALAPDRRVTWRR